MNELSTINVLSVLGFLLSTISIFMAWYAIKLRKSNLEITLYKNISDSIKNFLEFSSKKHTFQEENAITDYDRIKRLLKLEVLNNLEYACKKYSDNQVEQKSFKEYYIHIIFEWEKQINTLKTNNSIDTFQNIRRVNSIFQEPLKKAENRLLKLIIGYIVVFGYLALLCKFAFPSGP